MIQWYERDGVYRKRLLREVEFVNEYALKFPKSDIGYLFGNKPNNFIVKYVIEYKDKFYGIWCTYPLLYPKVRIKVEVFELDFKERKIVPFDEGYHNTNGVLCLLLHYPNQWREEYGIEYIIERVNAWFAEGQHDISNNIPLNHNIDNELFVFPEPLSGDFEQEYGLFEYSKINENVCVATSISTRNRHILVEHLPKSLSIDGFEKEKGIIIFTSKPMGSANALCFSEIKSYFNCFKYGVRGFVDYAEKKGIKFPMSIVIIYKNSNFEGRSFILNKIKTGFTIKACRFTYFRVYEDVFSRVKDQDEIGCLTRKKVGLVGLGSIGSVVAAELARSGIGNFVLIDYDKLEIQNIGRHDLTLKDLDKYKVNGVQEKILDINPKANCQSYNFDVLDDYSFNLYNLFSCDLIVSTMDDQEAKYAIDSTLVPNGKKVVYSGAFYNSVAAFALISDKKMGCFQCISNLMDAMAENKEIPDFSALVPENEVYNCGMPTFPGGSINTHTVALLTARIVTDILLGKRETDETGQPFNLYLIGNERIFLDNKLFFEGFMDIKKYVLPGSIGCPICDQENKLSEEENQQYNSIMEKLKE